MSLEKPAMSSKKTVVSSKKTTLDSEYSKQAKQFTTDHKHLPAKKKKLKLLKTTFESFSGKLMSDMTPEEINNYYDTKSEMTELEKEITNAEELTDVTDFYLKNGRLLIDYYDHLDHNKLGKKRGRPAKSKTESEPVASLLSFFKPKSAVQTPRDDDESDNKSELLSTSPPIVKTISSMIQSNPSFQRADVYEQYLANTDPHYEIGIEYSKADDFCFDCGEYRELQPTEAILVCPSCGDEVQAVMESDKPSYKEPPHENMYFAYKRINHFKEQLSHFQAKETTKIPQEVYDVILVELKKEKKVNLASLTKTRVKRYLQKYTHLNYNKYYENINQIIYHLNGMQPLSMPPEVEDQLCNMFQMIQEPFEKHCPPDRTNFLSYSYVIHKFCQLLGYHEYLPYFNLLKSKDKLHQQDKIWKKICVDLDWTYYPSSH
jgi:hypothetical protein